MEDIMSNIVIQVATLTPLVAALVQVIKTMDVVPNKVLPLVAIVIGGLTGVGLALGFDLSLADYVLAGVISGLASAGLYDTIKTGGNL